MIMWADGPSLVLILQLPVQSVPNTTKVVNLNSMYGKMYSMPYYVIEFVSDFRQISGFLLVLRFPPPIKLNFLCGETSTNFIIFGLTRPGLDSHDLTNLRLAHKPFHHRCGQSIIYVHFIVCWNIEGGGICVQVERHVYLGTVFFCELTILKSN
jgi:hypothetical protein